MSESQTYEVCPVCRCPCTRVEDGKWGNIDCFRCGQYRINTSWENTLKALKVDSNTKIALVSGWLRQHQNEVLQLEPLAIHLTRKPPTVGEKAELLLRGLAEVLNVPGDQTIMTLRQGDQFIGLFRNERPFEKIALENEQVTDLRLPLYLMGVSYSQTMEELFYLLNDYLVREKNFVLSRDEGLDYAVSPAGWAHLEESARATDSIQAFVAMWFSEETGKLWLDGIRPAIVAAGYKPFRIDKHDHNNRIDDEIIASIRRSKFLVADFTGQRGGVYFEAGFALGLGQQVIWLVRHDALKEAHFDTRQYNHITWEPDKLSDLSRALQLRIEATVGRGPYVE